MTIDGDGGASKKRRTDGGDRRLSDSSSPEENLTKPTRKSSGGFNDAATADVILRLHFDHQSSPLDSSTSAVEPSELQIYLHSRVLHRSKYFAALLSDRWQQQGNDETESENCAKIHRFNLAVGVSYGSFDHHLTVLEMLYSDNLPRIDSVATAINVLPIALELLFEDCIKACVRFLEMVPWTEDEEERILGLVPLLNCDEEAKELVTRISVTPADATPSVHILSELVFSVTCGGNKTAFAKDLVAKLLRDCGSENVVRTVLQSGFQMNLIRVKGCLEDYWRTGDRQDKEARQGPYLNTAMSSGKNLLWVVERMVEVRVADSAIKEWCRESSFTENLQRVLRDDLWKDAAPDLPDVIMHCTSRLASCVVAGDVWTPRQMRLAFVRNWLPVLIICRETPSSKGLNRKPLYRELEETFLKIISTLSMFDAKVLLEQCLSFSTPNIDDCPHLTAAITTWFRRAERPPHPDTS